METIDKHAFVSDEDHWAYTGWLKEYSSRYLVNIHAWVMMTNHVHFLCTPLDDSGISKMMQAVGRRYVQYFNREYRWSSYQVNGLGKASELCTPHREYLVLGNDLPERQANYRELFAHHVEGELLKDIRSNTNKGMAVGSDRFKKEIEALTGRPKKPANPCSNRKI